MSGRGGGRFLRGFGVALALVGPTQLLTPREATARCTQALEMRQFVVSAGRELGCRQRRLVSGPMAPCRLRESPACAGTAAADVVTAVYGEPIAVPVDGAKLRPQLRCQGAIARATARFLKSRLRERAAGQRAQRRSRAAFQLVVSRCSVGVATDPGGSGMNVPMLGGPCAESVTSGGGAVDSLAVVGCLRPALERIVDQVAPTHLRPNVVLINTDDQRWDTVSVMPTIQELASRGVAFTNSFSTTPLCAPSRASLFTGRFAHNTGVQDNGGPHGGAHVFDDTSTIATWLHAAGYRTAHYGKYLNGYDKISPHVPPGWDDFRTFFANDSLYFDYDLVENGSIRHYGSDAVDYSTDVLAAMSRNFMNAYFDEPFFVYYAPFAPHVPATPAPRHAGRLAGIDPWRPPSYNQPDLIGKPGWVLLLPWSWSPTFQAAMDQFRIDQLESLLAVDEAVDGFLARLEALGLADNTVVIFTSDNGHSWGEHWWWGKECGYEECIRVPLVMHHPGASHAPRQEPGYVSNLDLAPTIAELAGASPPPNVNGRSLVALLDGRDAPQTDMLTEYWVRGIPIIPTWRSIRTDRWKYIRGYGGGDPAELYDLANDPYEITNIAGDPANAALLGTLEARTNVRYAE